MNKIILILLTLLLLMLIFNHTKDESKSEVEKKLFEELSGKVKYGDGKPRLIPIPAPTGNARDYPGDLPVLGPPAGMPWCPPDVKKGSRSLPPDNERTECVN